MAAVVIVVVGTLLYRTLLYQTLLYQRWLIAFPEASAVTCNVETIDWW